MSANTRILAFSLAIVLLLVASANLYNLVGYDDATTWTGNVLRNWEEFGLKPLQGKMVTNPGGFEALSKPIIYKGHRSASLYPVLFVDRIFSATGHGLLAFHLIFSLILFSACWILLGKTEEAAFLGAVAVLCPGYVLYPAQIDPNAISVYMILPFAALILPLLERPVLSPVMVAGLSIVVFSYTALNWTTALGHGILIAFLIASRSVSTRRLALYVLLAGLSAALVTGASVLDKVTPGPESGSGPSLLDLVGEYTWGSSGYHGVHLPAARAALRLAAAMLLGFLPLIVACAYTATKQGSVRRLWLALMPLGAAVLGILIMRNYFGHHPWMSAPLVFPGLILSLRLLVTPQQMQVPNNQMVSKRRRFGQLGMGAACIAYSLAVVGAHRAYHADTTKVAGLIRHNTSRADLIILLALSDPGMAAQAGSLSEAADRRVVVLRDLSDSFDAGGKSFVVSSTVLKGDLPLIATSKEPAILSWRPLRAALTWYATNIARRKPQEQHFSFASEAVFRLYQLTTSSQLRSNGQHP